MIKISRDSKILHNNIQEWNNVTTIHCELFLAIIIVALISATIIYVFLRKNKKFDTVILPSTSVLFYSIIFFAFLMAMFFQTTIPCQDFLIKPTFDESYLNAPITIFDIDTTTPQQIVECDKISLQKLSKIKKEQQQVPIIKKQQARSKKLAQQYLKQRNQSEYTKDWQSNNIKYQYYYRIVHSNKVHKYKANIRTLQAFLKERPPRTIY